MLIFSIETSCDETAVALVEDGTKIISSVLATSRDFHEITGGIVPEIAARKQAEFIVPVIDQLLYKVSQQNPNFAGKNKDEITKEIVSKIDAIAVTVGPGLIGSLVVGVEAAKTLALVWDKPIIPVNHLIGHIYADFIQYSDQIQFPAVCLVVSGGHTDLVLMRGHGDIVYLGSTLDDAAGEVFDKTARLLGLAKYLGGAKLSETAAKCEINNIKGLLPRPMLDQNNFDFSFSGLKTAVKRLHEKNLYSVEQIACEFEEAVVDVLTAKTIKAALKFGAKAILIGGGVSANKRLRSFLSFEAEKHSIPVYVPDFSLCTDSAVYIASAAYFNYEPKELDKITADPSLTIVD